MCPTDILDVNDSDSQVSSSDYDPEVKKNEAQQYSTRQENLRLKFTHFDTAIGKVFLQSISYSHLLPFLRNSRFLTI